MKGFRCLRIAGLVALFPWMLAGPASGDILQLKNGNSIEGKVLALGEEGFTLKVPGGTLRFSRDEVASLELKEVDRANVYSPLEEYELEVGRLSADDAEGHFRLGLYCERNNLLDQAGASYRKAAEADPSYREKTEKRQRGIREKVADRLLRIGERWGGSLALKYYSRVVQTYPGTKASEKARKRIGAIESAERRRKEALSNVRGGKWRSLETPNFILYYQSDDVARELPGLLERERTKTSLRLGFENLRPWLAKCFVYVFPDRKEYLNASRAPDWSAGWSVQKPRSRGAEMESHYPGWSREIMTYEDVDHLDKKVIPHEVAHLVLREKVLYSPELPRWLDEGVAVGSEGVERKDLEKALRRAYRKGGLFPLRKLAGMKAYPEDERLFYAQSASLVSFLLIRCGPRPFVRMCNALYRGSDFEEAFREGYWAYFRTLGDLERSWHAFLEGKYGKRSRFLFGFSGRIPPFEGGEFPCRSTPALEEAGRSRPSAT